jgi:hypothetical protein
VPPDKPPVAALMVNVSMSGAAIRVFGWDAPEPEEWPIQPKHGEELEISGLLDVSLSCWVVALDDGVLRVRFLLDETLRPLLRDKIDGLASV